MRAKTSQIWPVPACIFTNALPPALISCLLMSASKSWRIRIVSLVAVIVFSGQPLESLADKAGDDFNLGVGFWRKSRWALSAETFEQFVKDYPEHVRVPLARFYLGLSYSSLRKYDQARTQFQEYAKLSPEGSNLAAARYRIGECSYYLGDFEAAAMELAEYVKLHPADKLAGWGRLQLGEALVQLERWGDADATLQDVLANTTDKDISRQAQYTLALSLEKQRKANDAVAAYRRVAQLGDTPEAVRALARAGTIRFRQEQYDRASALYDEIVTRFPKSRHAPSASLHSGRALYRSGRFEDAIRRFERVAEDSSESVEAKLFTGMSLVKLERLEEARSTLQQAFDTAGDSELAAEILFEQSRLEQVAGQHEKAAIMYTDLADRWPNDPHVPDALFNAASLRLELSDTPAAQRLLQRLQKDFPEAYGKSRTRFLSGRLMIQLEQPTAAREAFQQVLDSGDADPRSAALCVYYIAGIDHEARQYEAALKRVQQLIPELSREDNQDLHGILALGAMSALELGQFDESEKLAIRFLEKTKEGPQAEDARAALIVARANTAQYEAALADADLMIDKAPTNPQTWTAILQSAEHAWDQEQFQPAMEFFRRANNKQAPEATQQSGASGNAWSLFKLNQFAEAAAAFGQTASAWPRTFTGYDARYMQIRSLQETGKLDEAVRGYSAIVTEFMQAAADMEDMKLKQRVQAFALDSGRSAARLQADAGHLDEANQQWAAVADAFANADELDSILDEWAWLNLKNEKYARADEVYRRLLKERPKSRFAGTARLSLAESLMIAEQTDEAMREFRAIAEHPDYAEAEKARALFHLVEINTERQAWEQVVKFAEMFGAQHSGSSLAAQVQMMYADGLLGLNRPVEAGELLELLRRGVISGDLKPEAWTERVWVALGEAALTAKDYAKVDELAGEFQSRFSESLHGFQMSYLQGRRWTAQAEPDFEKAREFFEQVIYDETGRGTRTAAQSQFLIAETRLREREYELAAREYFKVSTLYRFADLQAQALFQAGGCQEKTGRTDEAQRTWKSLIEEFPDSPFAGEAAQVLKTKQESVAEE